MLQTKMKDLLRCAKRFFAQKFQQIRKQHKKYCFIRSLNVIVDILEHCLTTSRLNLATKTKKIENCESYVFLNFTGIHVIFFPCRKV
jgi:hypothetical protein